uniref:Uncharacterized protein n=1 Tax=Clastoptera arizonana TaxID=38151 RepID=A0A1B6C7W5_9HEMI
MSMIFLAFAISNSFAAAVSFSDLERSVAANYSKEIMIEYDIAQMLEKEGDFSNDHPKRYQIFSTVLDCEQRILDGFKLLLVARGLEDSLLCRRIYQKLRLVEDFRKSHRFGDVSQMKDLVYVAEGVMKFRRTIGLKEIFPSFKDVQDTEVENRNSSGPSTMNDWLSQGPPT